MNKILEFSWEGFCDPQAYEDPTCCRDHKNCGIACYEIAFGDANNDQAYLEFTLWKHTSHCIVEFEADDAPELFPEGVFPDRDYKFTVRAVNFAGLISEPVLEFHDDMFYDDAPDGIYVCTVQAVNTSSLISEKVSAAVKVTITRPLLGQEIMPPEGTDAMKTTWEGDDVFRVDHAGRFFTKDSGEYYNIAWRDSKGEEIYQQTFFNLETPVKEPMIIEIDYPIPEHYPTEENFIFSTWRLYIGKGDTDFDILKAMKDAGLTHASVLFYTQNNVYSREEVESDISDLKNIGYKIALCASPGYFEYIKGRSPEKEPSKYYFANGFDETCKYWSHVWTFDPTYEGDEGQNTLEKSI